MNIDLIRSIKDRYSKHIALAIALIVTIIFIAMIVALTGGDTGRYRVKDGKVVTENNKEVIETNYGDTSDKCINIIKNDKYIQKYELEESTRQIIKINNSNKYNISNTWLIASKEKDNINDYINIKLDKYDNIKNITGITLIYGYDKDEQLKDIDDSALDIVKKMFNSNIAKDLTKESEIQKTTLSKSGDYGLNISKRIENEEESKRVVYTVAYNKMNSKGDSLKNIETDLDNYNKIQAFNNLEKEKLTSKIDSILNKKGTYISELTNNKTNKEYGSMISFINNSDNEMYNISIAMFNSEGKESVYTTVAITTESNNKLDKAVDVLNKIYGSNIKLDKDNKCEASIELGNNEYKCTVKGQEGEYFGKDGAQILLSME